MQQEPEAKLNATGEDRLAGRGSELPATCDGYFFKDGKNVIVVGGGAILRLTDALYLDSLGAHVTIVHRRDAFRAEDRLQQSVFQRNMPVMWNTSVKEITGALSPGVGKVKVEDTKYIAGFRGLQAEEPYQPLVSHEYSSHREGGKGFAHPDGNLISFKDMYKE